MKPLRSVLAASLALAFAVPGASAGKNCHWDSSMNMQMCDEAPANNHPDRAPQRLGLMSTRMNLAQPAPAPTPAPARPDVGDGDGGRIVAGGPGTPDLPAPAGTPGCPDCYTKEQLGDVAKAIVAHDDDTPYIAQVLANPVPPDAPIHRADVYALAAYFNREEKMRDDIKNFLQGRQPQPSAEQLRSFENDPGAIRDYVQTLPRESRAEFWHLMQHEVPELHEAMAPLNGKNPFHTPLMTSDDPITKFAMHDWDHHGEHHRDDGNGDGAGSGAGSVMTPGEWQQGDPNNPAAYVQGAEQAAESGDLAGAVAQASHALSLDPDNARALDIRGAANYDLHNMDDAKADATKALALNADDKTAQAILSLADGHAMGASSAKGILSGLASSSEDPGVRAGTTKVSSLAALAASVPANVSASAAEAREAMAALTVGDAGRALRAADLALASNPNNLQALNLRAMALLRQRQYNDALASVDAGLRKDPKNRMLLNTRAVVLNKLKRFEDAAAAARALIEANPKDAAAWRSLSEALAGLGDKKGALDALQKASALDPRFNKMLETALQLPADADLNLLFSDDLASGGAAPGPAASSRSSRKLRRFGLVFGAALAAGLMMFLGAAPALKRSMGQAWTRITRRPYANIERRDRATDLIKGQYRPGRQIGFGGMGTVYEGLDVNLQRVVAIKKMRDEIKADPRERARFVQEAKLVAALHHPAIVDIYAIAEEGDDVYLVFEFIKGKTLYDHVVSRGRLSLDEALPILRGVVDGLEYAHSRGIIHRDLKPSNIMLKEDGGVKVMDFGIARVAKDAMTKVSQLMTNTIVGTPPYMAPEQEQGLVRKESDVYALALCLYEMLTGRMAFAGTGAGMLMSKINKAYAPVTTLAPELPSGIDAVFAAALEPEPGKRLSTPRELLDRVAAAAGSRRS